jgi:hypothetical protein
MHYQDILIFLQIVLVALEIINLAGGKMRAKLLHENTRITKTLKRDLESGKLDQ